MVYQTKIWYKSLVMVNWYDLIGHLKNIIMYFKALIYMTGNYSKIKRVTKLDTILSALVPIKKANLIFAFKIKYIKVVTLLPFKSK